MLPRKTDRLTYRLSAEDKAMFMQASELDGLELSVWVRLTLRKAAQARLAEAGLKSSAAPKKRRA